MPGVGSGVATGANVAGAAAGAGFSVLKLVVVLAIIAGVAGSVVVLRHHHLAEGYLYQDPTGGLIYFNIQESWYGGDVSGTFYAPYVASCQNGGQANDLSLHFDGTVSDSQVVLEEKVLGFTVSKETFTRSGDDLLWTGTELFSYTVPQTGNLDFKPSSDDGYNTAKQQLAQAACAGQ
jgi:hypothetical protein